MSAKLRVPSIALLRTLRQIALCDPPRFKPCISHLRVACTRTHTSSTARASSFAGIDETEQKLSSQKEAPTPLRKQLKDEARASRGAPKSENQESGPHRGQFTAALRRQWELTVGIEIHAELATAHKLFSPATTTPVDSSSQPNSHVSVFDAAIPGAQPQFQQEVLLPALRAALALNCQIQNKSSWDRKHYFWWDQPNGYQITQYYAPFATNGVLHLYPHDDPDPIDLPADQDFLSIGIKQIQMEQDTAKTVQQPPATQLLDLNRVSHPLIEIITLPQIHTPKTASAVVRKIQSILRAVGANTTGMEMGGLRADVNVSVLRRGDGSGKGVLEYGGVSGLGQRVEIKNLSSFKMVEDAISSEAVRQIAVLDSGRSIEGETRRFNGTETKRIRGKEGEVDYRYMPDPDLGSVVIGEDLVRLIKQTLPQVPDDALVQLTSERNIYDLTTKDAKTLLSFDDGVRAEYYFQAVHYLRGRLQNHDDSFASMINESGRVVGNWVLHELGSSLSKRDTVWSPDRIPSPQTLGDILALLLLDRITMPTARQLLDQALDNADRSSANETGEYSSDFDVAEEVRSQGLLLQPLSEAEYEKLAITVVASNEKLADKIRKGGSKQEGKIMWFVGQMVRTGEEGRIQPEKAERFIKNVIYQIE